MGKFVIRLLVISGAIAYLIKQGAIYLPSFSQIDLNTMAITAISIPVVIYALILLWRG
ncbi:hypothetical protein Syn7502_02789 [Synechococcus sp. PCC 7502]|uniref:hypothetical protein n=1 Tax=Synechococcus sp. PCC 7502 TaxID=1173263 RepID=UPI00029F9E50|nr:hypothetical protein [Synechococcus sp. PCC 7502]AFY74727.1 hypothetical protein Syn7502_02789 [Synechococcus sp. PCC 7502]